MIQLNFQGVISLSPTPSLGASSESRTPKREYLVENESVGLVLPQGQYSIMYQVPLKGVHSPDELWLCERVENVPFSTKSGMVISGQNQNPMRNFTQNDDISWSKAMLNN
jgi:hypothetical protein